MNDLLIEPDPRVLELIPHRPPMLLVDKLVSVDKDNSVSEIFIHEGSSFFTPEKGVPACIGLEYMGQTAALIAGYQQQQGIADPFLGFLLGSRKYYSTVAFFEPGLNLLVSCQQIALVGGNLANFQCTIADKATGDELVTGTLSVLRKSLDSDLHPG